jgi:hypothetical protein
VNLRLLSRSVIVTLRHQPSAISHQPSAIATRDKRLPAWVVTGVLQPNFVRDRQRPRWLFGMVREVAHADSASERHNTMWAAQTGFEAGTIPCSGQTSGARRSCDISPQSRQSWRITGTPTPILPH